MTELFEYLRNNGDRWGYDHGLAVYNAHHAGLVEKAEFITAIEVTERRWGCATIYVYELDGVTVAIQVYVMHADDSEDIFEDVYEVEPYEYTETRYRRK